MQNYMKTIISAIKAWTGGKIKDSTADWNQNDPNSNSYIKNRTHWEEEKFIPLISNSKISPWYYWSDDSFYTTSPIEEGSTYKVSVNGADYELTSYRDPIYGDLYLGNTKYLDEEDDGTAPFLIYAYGDEMQLVVDRLGTYIISIADSNNNSICEEETITIGMWYSNNACESTIEPGKEYCVSFNDKSYCVTAEGDLDQGIVCLGEEFYYFNAGFCKFYSTETIDITTLTITDVSTGLQALSVRAPWSYEITTIEDPDKFPDLQESNTYTVVWDNQYFTCTAKTVYSNGSVYTYLGNNLFLGVLGFEAGKITNTDEPFCFLISTGYDGVYKLTLCNKGGNPHIYSIYSTETVVHKIDPKYLPDSLTEDLAPVAKSGSYYDLVDTPEVYPDAVRYDAEQYLTDWQKNQARANIGASDFSGNYNDLENKLVYKEEFPEVIYTDGECTVSDTSNSRPDIGTVYRYRGLENKTVLPTEGEIYELTIGEAVHKVVCAKNKNNNVLSFGNEALLYPYNSSTGEDYLLVYHPSYRSWDIFLTTQYDTVNVSLVKKAHTIYHQLDEKFIPDTIARSADLDNLIIQADWNQNDETALDYVKNRTHYEGVITSDTLTWDGNIEGKIGVNDMFYLVSEAALTFEDFANGAIVTYIYPNGNIIQREWTSDRIDVRDNGSFELANQQVIVIPESAAGTNGPYSDTFFEKAGIYFLNYEGIYTSALTINGYSFETPYIKKLDLKFLPDNIGGDGSGIYVQETEPTDAEDGALWVDTANDPSFIAPNLPEVTTADNGKVLMVVDGRWQAVNLNLSVDADGNLSI